MRPVSSSSSCALHGDIVLLSCVVMRCSHSCPFPGHLLAYASSWSENSPTGYSSPESDEDASPECTQADRNHTFTKLGETGTPMMSPGIAIG